jgi:hypothetical protein
MCGIFGAVIGATSPLRHGRQLERSVERLFLLSESRGKEAAGLAISNDAALAVYKAAIPARDMIRASGYRTFLRDAVKPGRNGIALIGHSRLVTDGGRELNRNNQPVIGAGIAGIHNGIIVNHAALWQRHAGLQRRLDVDSEVIFALIREQLGRGATLIDATRATFGELQGAASVAALLEDRDQLLLATNTGSLYYRHAPSLFVFTSESYIMDRFAAEHADLLAHTETVRVQPGHGVVVDLAALTVEPFALDGAAPARRPEPRPLQRTLIDRAAPDEPAPAVVTPALDVAKLEARFPYRSMRDRLRRCSRCVLPETMPFIEFDAAGVCNWCRSHRPITWRGRDALEALVAPHRRRDGRPDCLVAVSGGRDSMFGLHYLKTVLGLNPVAYTYDWGMVTDLARRNVSRICGKLGIEHILVSADIPTKRENIRKNVEAWLAAPSLGTVPLFMAGDKAYFHYMDQARKQLGVELAFLCENPFERADFKTGFAGLPPERVDEGRGFRMSIGKKVAIAAYYARAFVKNPRYLNSSLLDSAKAFAFYYLASHDFYHNLYWYTGWDEPTIEEVLLGTYDFELSPDTKTTWRIGDGTAAFYNYIYYAIAGLTENDTFRSNQIRAGAMTRERALELIDRDNRPRFPSIRWYLDTIGIRRPIEDVLAAIEAAPKRY